MRKFKALALAAIGVAAIGGTTGVADAATKHATKHAKKHAKKHTKKHATASTTSSTSSTDTGPASEPVLTGDTKTSAESAALTAVPGGTVTRSSVEDPSDASGAAYEVHVTKADGSRVEVLEDSAFKVLSVNADDHQGGGGCHGDGDADASSTGTSSDTSTTTTTAGTRRG